MLSSKSDQEISWMLDDYGIKHGPVVGSTRSLYEKKLRDMMAKRRKMTQASERAIYKKQQDEDVYLPQRKSWGQEVFSSRGNAMFSTEDREVDIVEEPMVSPYYTVSQGKYTAVRQERTQEKTQSQDSGRFVPLWLQMVVFLLVAAVLVFIFINMEAAQPFRRLT
ncbi:hypothetical protein QTP70_034084 [Hemibagrus guttatus]|uniref:LEM domain-containing protein n=1 Tax=Hemibagrus guttatus TaxID=175788 RepID=A0AAE0R4R3_9TELE|nr:hypothetical protein QTP70_034084 [Hemibagrus guttatus]KAK3566449.1 hypothetical protein QTP86_033622 [Hemibagrus guttatus]